MVKNQKDKSTKQYIRIKQYSIGKTITALFSFQTPKFHI